MGVGESTLGSINNWLAMLEIDEKDFIPHTDASLKLSIRFQNFYLNNNQHFHYPFGQPDVRASHAGTNDWLFKKFLKFEGFVIVDKFFNCFISNSFIMRLVFFIFRLDLNKDKKSTNT